MNLLLVDVRENYTAFVPARGPRPPPKLPSSKPVEEDPIDRDAPAASKVTGLEGLGGGRSGDGGCAGPGGVAGSRDTLGPEGRGKLTAGAGGAAAADDERFVGVCPADGSEPTGALAWGVTDTGGFKGGRRREGSGHGGGSSEKIDPRDPRMAVAAAAAASGAAEVACSNETKEGGARTATRTKLLPQEWGVNLEREEGEGVNRRTSDSEGQRPRPPLPPAGRQGGDDNRGEGGGGGASGETRAAEGRKKKATRRSRSKGPWTGELKPVARRRYLKQLLIRGDNVVMIWEAPKS